jgi:autotransporter-associated beta strand protein
VKAGATSWLPSSFTHSGNTLNFDLGVYNVANPPVIDVAALTLNTTDITVNISGSSIPISSEIRILDYGTKSGTGSLKLNIASLPTNMVATLEENTVDGYYYLNVTSPSATAFTWSGDTNADGTGDWDAASLNWNANTVAYAQPALATFPNIVGGGTVTITTDVAPLALDINNAVNNNYTFAGTGKITGNTGITKAGAGIATFDVAAHTYSGTLAVNTGAVIKNVADATSGDINVATNAALGLTGGITDGSGQTLSLSGPGLTVANGVFAAVQRGALQSVSGDNTWAGNISIPVAGTGLRIGTQNDAKLTLNGNITEAVSGCAVILRLGNTVGSDITVNGTANNWTGDTQVFGGGKLILGADNALPTASRLLVGTSGIGFNTYLDLNGNDQTSAGLNRVNYSTTDLAFITNDGATPSVLTLQPATDQSWLGVIKDGANPISLVISGTATQGLALSSTYTGTTTIESGRLEILENQSASGDVIINGGSLKLSNVKTLASGVNMSIASGAFFYLDGSSQTLGKLEGSGTIDFTYNVAGVDTLTVGANDATSTFSGVIQQSQPRTYALRKIGTGTFALTGPNTYTGNTTVEDGTLSVAQSNFANTSTVTIGLAEASPAVLHLPNAGTDIVTDLIIDGISQPGNGAVYDSTNSGSAITGNGKIQVGLPGYPAWVIAKGVLEGEAGDDDKDGISNLVEYALGLDPQASSHPAGDFTGNTLTFTKGPEAKAAGDVTYTIETSTTLEAGSWSTAAAANGPDTISYTLPDGQGRIFGRLKVTKP